MCLQGCLASSSFAQLALDHQVHIHVHTAICVCVDVLCLAGSSVTVCMPELLDLLMLFVCCLSW